MLNIFELISETMNNSVTAKNSKKQIIIWGIVLVATALLLFVVIYLLLNGILKQDTKSDTGNKEITINSQPQRILEAIDLQKSFSGTRETIDGNIEAVLFKIKSIDSSNLSFEFTLNIGLSKKLNGFGSFELNSKKITADVLGDLLISYDDDNRIILRSTSDKNQIKFNLIEETR